MKVEDRRIKSAIPLHELNNGVCFVFPGDGVLYMKCYSLTGSAIVTVKVVDIQSGKITCMSPLATVYPAVAKCVIEEVNE